MMKLILLWLLLFASISFTSPIFSDPVTRDPFQASNKPVNASLQTMTRLIHYADATILAHFINNTHHHFLSADGFIAADQRTNKLWISDHRTQFTAINKLLDQLDIPVAQLLIKARMVNVDQHSMRALGAIFNGVSSQDHQKGNRLLLDASPPLTTMGSVAIPIVKFGNGSLLDLTLTALQQEGHAEMISSPELLTNNRQTAVIESGEEVPYQEKTGQGNTSVAFKKATLSLKVTPMVLPGNRVLLQLAVNQDKISSILVNGVPAIRTQQLATTVLVKDQETVVLGGIYEQASQREEAGVPVLRHIPLLGALFRQRQHSLERKQLLIFITPRIINEKQVH